MDGDKVSPPESRWIRFRSDRSPRLATRMFAAGAERLFEDRPTRQRLALRFDPLRFGRSSAPVGHAASSLDAAGCKS